jgi:hypothetical protein
MQKTKLKTLQQPVAPLLVASVARAKGCELSRSRARTHAAGDATCAAWLASLSRRVASLQTSQLTLYPWCAARRSMRCSMLAVATRSASLRAVSRAATLLGAKAQQT